MTQNIPDAAALGGIYKDRTGYGDPLYVSGEAVRLLKLASQKYPSMLEASSPDAISLLEHIGVIESDKQATGAEREWNVTIDAQGNVLPETDTSADLPERNTLMHSFNYASLGSVVSKPVRDKMRALDILSSAVRNGAQDFDVVLDNALPGWRSKDGRGFNAASGIDTAAKAIVALPGRTAQDIANDQSMSIGARARTLGCSQATIAGMTAKGRTFG